MHGGGCRHVSSGSPQPIVARLEARGSPQSQKLRCAVGHAVRPMLPRVAGQGLDSGSKGLHQSLVAAASTVGQQRSMSMAAHVSHDQQAEALATLLRWTCCIVC